MIFQLGRTKSSAEKKVEYDQAPRWRQPAIGMAEEEYSQNDNIPPSNQRPVPAIPQLRRPDNEPVQGTNAFATSNAAWAPAVDATAQRTPTTGRQLEDEDFKKFIKTAIAPGTVIEGRFTFDSPVRIDGDMTGEIISSSTLIVGEQASVKAKIKVGSLIIFGKVVGEIQADDLVEIKEGGSLEASIDTDRIAIEEGGYFRGSVNVEK